MSAKKGSKKVAPETTTYAIKDVVLGKLRGFAAWPAWVVDPEAVPQSVRRERPGGKASSTYVVQFFPAGDYAWLTPKDISKLQKHEIEAYINEPHKTNKELLAGYRAALNPTEWEESRNNDLADADDDDEEEEEEGRPEVDELAGSDDDSSRGKKRKKSATSSSAAAGGSKKRKKDDSVSASAAGGKGGKKRGGESASAASKKGGAKGGKKNGKSKAMVESEDEGGDAAEEEDPTGPTSKKASPPPTKKAKKDDAEETSADPEAVKVREWRHKLQKTFLSNKGTPKESEMPAMDQLFTTIESYDKMDVFYLSFSKIGKVMRHIAALKDNQVPKDDKFRFRERAKKLIDRWHVILETSKEGGVKGGKEINGANGAPTANGNHSPEQNLPNGALSPNREQGTGLTGDMSMLGDVTMSEAGIDA
ncbi:hypothetical protein AAF712_002826 [Marasmius tenuissimus]|uniref:PWWP domain-containing protein n=1 Tax=Marasmius tenuissimus TaxID=585030 RepID=A0ABR3A998_9AGAR|nr:hypothetical protein PM082_000541 [Marasmius tenuissimus]